jgi:hypothetical protein
MIDERLLDHWERESAARARLRDSLPASWRNDPRPNMDVVRELYVEAMLRLKHDRRSARLRSATTTASDSPQNVRASLTHSSEK